MSQQQSTPDTPWSTEPEKRGRRLAVILGALAAVLLAVLGGCALLGRGGSDPETGEPPTKSADQIAAEKVAQRVATAAAEKDPAWCDATTEPMWWRQGVGGMLNEQPNLADCKQFFEDETDEETVTITSVRSIDLRPAVDAWGVELVLSEPGDDTPDSRAYKVVLEDGAWKVDNDDLITDDDRAVAASTGVDPIAAGLGIDTREGAK